MKAVGVYIYAGGFSIGIRKKFDIVAHLEDPKPYGDNVIALNRDNYWGDLKIHPHPSWPDIDGVDLLYANPPCAPFSNANTRSFKKDSWRDDPRISCWHNTAEYAIKNDIPFVTIETVPQAYSKAPSMLMEKAEEFSYAGYRVYILLHNACYMGSCQNRPRLMFIATKHNLYLTPYDSLATTTVIKKMEDFSAIYPYEDYSFPCSEKYQPVLDAAKPGERMRSAWERLNPPQTRILNKSRQVKGRPTFGVKKPHPDRLLNTIVGYPIIHPSEPRYMTLKETQILGDFPANYKFPNKQSSLSLIARGVSSQVGEYIAEMAELTLTRKDVINQEHINKLTIINGLQGFDNNIIHYVPIEPGQELPAMSLRSKGL